MDLKCAYLYSSIFRLDKNPNCETWLKGGPTVGRDEGAKDLIWSSFYSKSLVLKTALF